ncbi:MAG: hypothetical protein AB1646_11525 [Thermodesulfobacteriota bacterium]
MHHRSGLRISVSLCLVALSLSAGDGLCQVEMLEVFCQSCGFRGRFLQGADQEDAAKNIQHIIVVCERTREIRNIRIPLNPDAPVHDVPLLARQYGTGKSELLGVRLPKFLVPGTTCPLFPLTSYLEWNICPVDGRPGISVASPR